MHYLFIFIMIASNIFLHSFYVFTFIYIFINLLITVVVHQRLNKYGWLKTNNYNNEVFTKIAYAKS